MTKQYSTPVRHHIYKIPGSSRLWWGISLAAGLALLLLIMLAGEKSLFKVMALYKERDHLKSRLIEINQYNLRLEDQIRQLKSGAEAVERIAREELGMVKPNEMVYRFVPASHLQPKRIAQPEK